MAEISPSYFPAPFCVGQRLKPVQVGSFIPYPLLLFHSTPGAKQLGRAVIKETETYFVKI